MAEMSRELDLEHKDAELALNLDRLTVRVKLDGTWRLMAEIGSGANWVGYHLLALLALQRSKMGDLFRRFCCLINQARSISHRTRSMETRATLQSGSKAFPKTRCGRRRHSSIAKHSRLLYKRLFDAVRQSQGRLQIIVTDHANLLDEPDFQDAITEEWRDGRALIQEPWPIGNKARKPTLPRLQHW